MALPIHDSPLVDTRNSENASKNEISSYYLLMAKRKLLQIDKRITRPSFNHNSYIQYG